MKITTFALGIVLAFSVHAENIKAHYKYVKNEKEELSDQQKGKVEKIIEQTINQTESELSAQLAPITFTIKVVDWNLSPVYGVTGRTDKIDEIEISISSIYENGLDGAIEDGLRGLVFHELHHAVRGWTMHNNKFPKGIDIAAINEGLADVFAEKQINRGMNKMPQDVDFDAWVKEIKQLPKDANYGHWMGFHPDGRIAVGYRAGAYVVKLAMKNSGKDIIELSQLSIEEIYRLADI